MRPLFLDALHQEFEQITALKKGKKAALQAFHAKLGTLGFLDPACGCGNFLVVSYRELKELELQVALAMRDEENKDPVKSLVLDVKRLSKVSINQFYGIEIEEFPVAVARVSMWLMEHVMNVKFGKSLGFVIPSIPLHHSAEIVCANALTTPWESVAPPERLHYILGNPPFAGRRNRTVEQQAEVAEYFPAYKDVDYVACWLKKVAIFLDKHEQCQIAFVATNSVTQGEQVYHIWRFIIEECNFTINFAFQAFKWKNEAKNNAIVHCVIIGFGGFNSQVQHLKC